MLLISLIQTVLVIVTIPLMPGNSNEDSQQTEECLFYLVPSLIPNAGRGIVAGKDYNAREFLHITKTILVATELCIDSQLDNYVFGFSNSREYNVIFVGSSQTYNHRNVETVSHRWLEEDVSMPNENIYETFSNFLVEYLAIFDTQVGTELFSSYGNERWFLTRGIKYQDLIGSKNDDINTSGHEIEGPMATYSYEKLNKYGLCLSNTIIKDSTIQNIGHSLFATKDFQIGDIVTISSMLALRKETFVEANSMLLNYCFGHKDSDMILFPVGDAAVINHSLEYNLEIKWFTWIEEIESKTNFDVSKMKNLQLSTKDLMASKFAPLDFAYIATKEIKKGEEPFLNYGNSWINDWNYVSITITNDINRQLQEQGEYVCNEGEECHVDESGNVIKTDNFPIFRRFIYNIEHLYQSHWIDANIPSIY